MTPEQAKQQIAHEDAYRPVKQAFADGKTIQVLDQGRWVDLCKTDFKQPVGNYRIRPEPREFWRNVYSSRLAEDYPNKEEADRCKESGRIECIQPKETK